MNCSENVLKNARDASFQNSAKLEYTLSLFRGIVRGARWAVKELKQLEDGRRFAYVGYIRSGSNQQRKFMLGRTKTQRSSALP
jgi:hypothetical protein